MANLLAIDTSTDACSVALLLDGRLTERYEVIPRRHSQRLFGMLGELLDTGDLVARGIHGVAYGSGPGSFTGLRVCASAVQGLCFANSLPALPVCTLLAQAQGAFREGLAGEGQYIVSTIDAHIGELYWRLCQVREGRVMALQAPRVAHPGAFHLPDGLDSAEVVAIGSGLGYQQSMPDSQVRWRDGFSRVLPRAQDVLALGASSLGTGREQRPAEVAPVYVRDEISWKKLPEQGRRA